MPEKIQTAPAGAAAAPSPELSPLEKEIRRRMVGGHLTRAQAEQAARDQQAADTRGAAIGGKSKP